MTDPNPNVDDALREQLVADSAFLNEVLDEVRSVIVGQEELLRSLLIGLLADGHVLLEGLPGLAKSLTVQTLATALGGSFSRVQFTPDLLPADLLGTQVYDPREQTWSVKRGPVFAQFVLADEINRAPAKVQSALLEAMQERQVSLGGETHRLPDPFLVLATQNPVEQEGTYALPEAQVDRFLLKVVVGYPTREDEERIVERMATVRTKPTVRNVADPQQILKAREHLDQVYVDALVRRYVVDLVLATREPEKVGLADLAPMIQYGASPRASIGLTLAAKAEAMLDGRPFVTPADVRTVGMGVLRHRILTSYEAEASGLKSEEIVHRVFDAVPVP